MSKLGDDARTADAARGREDLRLFDVDILVEHLHRALDAEEAVQRFFVDRTPTRGPMWVALTRQRLLLIERRGLIGFRPRSLPRPLEARLRPKYSDPWIVAIRASNGETTALVLDWAEAEAMLSAETMPQVAEPTPSQVPPPDVLHDAHVSDPDGDPPHPRVPAPPSSVTAVHRRGRKPRPRPGPPRHLAPEPLEPPDAGSRPPTRPDLPATETRTGTGSAGVDAHRPTWSKRARKAARNWFRISIDPI